MLLALRAPRARTRFACQRRNPSGGKIHSLLQAAGDRRQQPLFRSAKYRPEFPTQGFDDLDAARAWAAGFMHWYNFGHRHSGIRDVSPAQRHAGDDHAILAARHALYLKARERHPARWSRQIRNWSPIGAVSLNPERNSVVAMAEHASDKQPLVA